jgi:hypothetical protein
MPPKDKKKEAPAGWNFDPIEGIVILLFLVMVLGTLIPTLWKYFISGSLSFYGFKLSHIVDFFKTNIQFFKALGFVIAGAAAVGTFVFTKKADAIWRVEKAKLFPAQIPTTSVDNVSAENVMTKKWEKILKLAASENSSDWRLAIIEADIILDELLEKLHLPGETMGDKLKAVEKSDFTTIENAWEAHKIRNIIAHEGGDFIINQREIRRVISLYETVFKEFFLI